MKRSVVSWTAHSTTQSPAWEHFNHPDRWSQTAARQFGQWRCARITHRIGICRESGPAESDGARRLDDAVVESALLKKTLRYDKAGEEHYNLISAYIKSMRDSDPDGALYWLARMLEGGEDPKFIARRLVIFASEDVGNADPTGVVVATAIAQAVQFVGLPEAQINLAHGTTYFATRRKDNASYIGLLEALQDAKPMEILAFLFICGMP